MNIMNIFKKGKSKSDAKAQALYAQLMSPAYQVIYQQSDLDEGMGIAEEVICQYCKPRFLLDHNVKCAYEFMTNREDLTTVTVNDIDWDSLKGLPEESIARAHRLDAHFPTRIRNFENSVAQVSWQLNPDGMYYMDEDGYGMTGDEEVEIYGFIDRKGKVVVKFKHINKDWNLLKAMRKEAESIINK
ncbi:MAG: hypothetical protein KBT20_10145 [Bacteroidales bacterium]|nr:hypothetical protein [Candidatus Liminaster caballi]